MSGWPRLRSAGVASLCAALGCSGEAVTQGFEEPIRALDTQFREGDLPGSPPLTAAEVNAGVKPKLPTVTSVTLPNALIPQGEPSRTFRGRASEQGTAVGVRFADLGSGYWLLPTRNTDPLSAGELEWSFDAAFRHDVPAGVHRLLFAAIDAEGHSGSQSELSLCVTPEVPDNGNACDPATSPPTLVVSLSWDAPVDLDLRVITPSGKVVDSKHPSTATEDDNGDIDPNEAGAGVIVHDSQAHCLNDGRRRENLVFQGAPTSGTYLVYANLYDPCGESGVIFDVSLHTAVAGSEPDTFAVEETFTQSGQLQAVHANGGTKLGMFVTSFNAR
jgi:hypothetical protein